MSFDYRKLVLNDSLWYSIDNTDSFILANYQDKFQTLIEKYNELISNSDLDRGEIRAVIKNLIVCSRGIVGAFEFSQVMIILLLSIARRKIGGGEWVDGAHIALKTDQIEICRELLHYSLKEVELRTIKKSHEAFSEILKEDKEQNAADILGMIIDELSVDGLTEDDYHHLMQDFVKILVDWRELKVPKCFNKEAYGLMNDLLKNCYTYKAYHTAVALAGLLYVSDQTKKREHLSDTMYLMGKILYELGYKEVAKRCFIFADEDTGGKCWKEGDEDWKILLGQECQLELCNEITQLQQRIEADIISGKTKLYTWEELKAFRAGKMEIPVIVVKQQAKDRKKLGDKAIKTYEKSANTTPEERLQAITAAFAIFTEAPEGYPEAAYLYFLKANIYLDKGELETAYDCFKKAYNCKDGKRNGMVLLGLAIVLSQMGRMKESTAYLFRTYILCGKDFIIDNVGEEPWKMVEVYLDKGR